jgi:ADP-ribose pyrophosphatase YjhB (NUDIX family)
MTSVYVYGCICISPQGEILLVRNRIGHKWSFPKGHLEKSDSSGIDCARRELMEEAGINAPENSFGTIELRAGIYYVFLFSNTNEMLCSVNDKREVDMAEWFSLKELPEVCNVDVSMFKNLIKLYRNIDVTTAEKTMKYITSEYSMRKFQDMNKRLEKKAIENKNKLVTP